MWSKGDRDGRKAEHLSAFGLIKRLWPERFVQSVQASRWHAQLQDKPDFTRYVVSTHVMALAPSMERLIQHGPATSKEAQNAFAKLAENAAGLKRSALPRRLMQRELRKSRWWETATRFPALVEQARERAGEADEEQSVDQVLARIEMALGVGVERYYALLLMDGDRLGSWLSGSNALTFGEVFHTRVKAGLANYQDDKLTRYLEMTRPVSPARHMAISSALNGFALDLVRHVIEDECLGKMLYAGGDDVMAMLSVRDVLKAMALLRTAYSGGLPPERAMPIAESDLEQKRGFVQWRGRLYQVMGDQATASCGTVIAHHQAPLGAVLRELRAAENAPRRRAGAMPSASP